jgi:hypothetical protein
MDARAKGEITEAEFRIQKSTLGATLDKGAVAPPKTPAVAASRPAPVAADRGTSSGSSWSKTAYSPAENQRVMADLKAQGLDPSEGFNSTQFNVALDNIEKDSQKRNERIDRAELAAKMGHALGLMIAGGGAGKVGQAVGKQWKSAGVGEALGSNLGNQGAGEYTGEMLKAPIPDMEKARDREESSRQAREKTVLSKQQIGYSAWRDRMDQALRMADISKVSTSGSQQESDRPVKDKKPEDLNAYYKQLIETPKAKGEPAQITEDRIKALAAAGMTGEKAQFFSEDQGTEGTSWWEFIDRGTRAKYLKEAHANIDAKHPVGGAATGYPKVVNGVTVMDAAQEQAVLNAKKK